MTQGLLVNGAQALTPVSSTIRSSAFLKICVPYCALLMVSPMLIATYAALHLLGEWSDWIKCSTCEEDGILGLATERSCNAMFEYSWPY